MRNLHQEVEDGYLLGVIKYNDSYIFYLMPIAYWILNYTKYDPLYNPVEWKDVFRQHIYVVSDELIDNYIGSINEFILIQDDFKSINFKERHKYLEIYIDFDQKLFVSCFDYIEMETYLPNEKWVGKYENPVDYLPERLKYQLG